MAYCAAVVAQSCEARRAAALRPSLCDGENVAQQSKTPGAVAGRCALGVPDNDLLSHGSSVLSSACCRFTVLFGMGRRGASRLWSSGVAGNRGQGTGNSKLRVTGMLAAVQKVRVGLSCVDWRIRRHQQNRIFLIPDS